MSGTAAAVEMAKLSWQSRRRQMQHLKAQEARVPILEAEIERLKAELAKYQAREQAQKP